MVNVDVFLSSLLYFLANVQAICRSATLSLAPEAYGRDCVDSLSMRSWPGALSSSKFLNFFACVASKNNLQHW